MSSYPKGTVRSLLESELVSPATREVLEKRLAAKPRQRSQVFSDRQYAVLGVVCALLVPRVGEELEIDIAAAIDARLARGRGDGWRYASMPPDAEAYRLGLDALDRLARCRTGTGFVELDRDVQVFLLRDVQRHRLLQQEWMEPPPETFFEDLLVECVEVFYSHPVASESIGYVGMADGRGWSRLGLDEREPWEPHSEP